MSVPRARRRESGNAGDAAGRSLGALAAPDFARLMAALAPFEENPHIAVAVSGGRDSLALLFLAHDWATAAGGKATGLTVDHGLRPESAMEARQVARWARRQGIAHRTLAWRGRKPGVNLQAEARAARYRLLTDWCRGAGVLHLLLAHHREDQAETLLLRLARGSGLDGLAAMAPVVETPDMRLLRPVLDCPRARLGATLEARGQPWLDDPANEDARHARVRLRALMPSLAHEGLTVDRLAATASRLGRARLAVEAATADLLSGGATLDPAGYALLDPAALKTVPVEVALRALGHLLRAVGGSEYPARLARLERLHREIAAGDLPGARTLGGCRIVPAGAENSRHLLIVREPAAVAPACAIRPGDRLVWDGRFEVTLRRRPRAARGQIRVGPLGLAGWRAARAASPMLAESAVPVLALPTLPAFVDLDGPLAVPHLCYGRGGYEADSVSVCRASFRPPRPLAQATAG